MSSNSQMGFKLSLVFWVSLLYCWWSLQWGEAASNETHPQDIAALKIIAKKMRYGIWNFNLDPCSGKGSWNLSQAKGNETWVACNCTINGEKFCRVTQILLKKQDLSGVVPPEFANLTYLEVLDLTRNYLNGSVPTDLGSLVHLKNLSIGINRLSGQIPKEIGKIKGLLSLVLISNNFTGELPKEFATLRNIDKMHVANNQFSGKIPNEFFNLTSLTDFRACSNNFVGKIPDFIGNWKKISILKLQATSLKGPIPPVISTLTSLTDLRISDLTGERSNLSFVYKLKKLKYLVLRNASIYGKIPQSIGNFKKLKTLDLRFNNLTGSIPDSFMNFTIKNTAMENLYLGNNSLSGKLESWLLKINFVDLSYNKFSGDVPDWYSNSNQNKLNLVRNSFNVNLASPRNIYYLQRNFRCDPKYPKTLAINCGGKELNDSSVYYEGDENPLGSSSFYLGRNRNWAVSNTGNFMDNASQTKPIETFDAKTITEVYRTARLSSTSLRYYGLCLLNGQYTVQLKFAEIVFSNKKSYRSLGRRIFDVYIQGTKLLPNFNIEEAAGAVYKEVVKNFTVNVTDNTLEIHFLWAGKGTYNVPEEGTYGPLVSAIVISADSTVNERNKNKTPVIVGIVLGVVISLGLAVFLSFIFLNKRKGIHNRLPDDNREMRTISNFFSLEEIRSATNDFHSENKLGEGGFGTVFKGILAEGRMVAVKQLFPKSRQGSREFLNEISTISAVQHPNLVKLYGSCIEGKQLLLVYEYLENNNLARALFGPKEFQINLNWRARHKICLGVARGLAYLHEESRLRIVHRDIKGTNILLDQDLNPKISDFGLAKLFDQEKTHVSTTVAGTIGYMAPEYALRGHLTEKADVYSFGVVVLEIVSGRPHMDKKLQGEKVHLMEWAWTLYGENKLMDLVDVSIKSSSFPEEEILRTLNVGLLCIQANPTLRPSMSTIVNMLEGKIEVPVSGCQPPYFSYGQTNVIREEQPLSQSRSLEGPWKGSSSSQGTSSVNQLQKAEDNDNEENSLILHQVPADLYSFSISEHPSSQSNT